MAERVRGRAVLAIAMAAIVAAGALTGCSVPSSGAAVDIGDSLSQGGSVNDNDVRLPPGPDSATSGELVRRYLQASAGGDSAATDRLRNFLTPRLLKTLPQPEDKPQTQKLTIIRLVGNLDVSTSIGQRQSVVVHYQQVGTLTDQGFTDLPEQSETRSMTFYVAVPDNTSPRIDEIEGTGIPSGLLLTDDALNIYYRPQPIYFWDPTNRHLIPDLRYLPLTLNPDQRAQRVVQWLVDGPSPGLVGTNFAQRLPTGTTMKDGVTNEGGAWNINLSAPGGAGGPEDVARLYYQLQWSLRGDSTPPIKLSIEGRLQPSGSPTDYLSFNISHALNDVATTAYDIVKEAVVVGPDATSHPLVLKAPQNANVEYAAMNRAGDALAVVRATPEGKRQLQIARVTAGAVNPVVVRNVPSKADMGRPVWVPGTDLLLVTVSGQLWAVGPDGVGQNVMPQRSGITSVSVAPDGRRIAWVQGGHAFVGQLWPDWFNGTLIFDPRPVLKQQVTARAIAWTGEAWLFVVGTTANGAGALWRTTFDNAIAINVSEQLKGTTATDVVALSSNRPTDPGQVLLFAPEQLVYTFNTSAGENSALTNPFFVA